MNIGILKSNFKNIIAGLLELGITHVEILYSGGGDSGEVDEISVTPHELHSEINQKNITVTLENYWPTRQQIETSSNLGEAMIGLCYGVLSHKYSGWEDNEGASGQLKIDVLTNKCNLSHHIYFTESTLCEHEFFSEEDSE